MVRVVVCVSGGGTNLQAILDGVADGSIRQTQIVGVISNNPGVMALTRAEKAGVPGYCICPADYADREAFHQALLDKLAELSPDLIVLAGFLVRIPEEMIRRYERRILNIHPSLIPSYCGVGYYGLKAAARSRAPRCTSWTPAWIPVPSCYRRQWRCVRMTRPRPCSAV